MIITSETLISIKSQVEKLTNIAPQITDVMVSIQLKECKESDDKNFMYLTLINK